MRCRKHEPRHSSVEVTTEVCETVEECTVDEEPAVHEVRLTSYKRVPLYVDVTVESVDGRVEYLDEDGPATGVTGAMLPRASVGDPTERPFRFRLRRAEGAGGSVDTIRVRVRYYLRADDAADRKNDTVPDVHPEVEIA
jgi:hypothetical protein